jgi:hypothetical protein
MWDRLAILAYHRAVFECCRVLFHVLSRTSSRVVRTCCSHALSRALPRAVCSYRALSAREIKSFAYNYLCELISYLFNHQLLK